MSRFLPDRHKMFQNTLSQENIKLFEKIPELIKKTFPIPGRHKSRLPSDIAKLSELLTKNKGERSLSYLARPDFLNAYLYYFLPWNLYRLCLLLPGLNINLSPTDTIKDLGCGPLTFTSALWIARPDLRKIPLEFNCIDRCAPALEAGKKFFISLCETENNISEWKINLIKKDIDFRKAFISADKNNYNIVKTGKKKPASLVCAVNLFNETCENLSHNNSEGLRRIASNSAKLMYNEASESASILTVEPGVPQSGRFISLLRDSFIELNRPPDSPCTHNASCPLSPFSAQKQKINNKGKWCHFAQKTENIPKELNNLSQAAGLPKERIAFSFLLAGGVSREHSANGQNEKTRVISDVFQLPGNLTGCYGCSAKGLVLLTGEKNTDKYFTSGGIVTPIFDKNGQRDNKSGALIARLSMEK